MLLGLGIAVLCAALTNLAFLLKHRGAGRAPGVDLQHPLRSARGLLRQPWFSLGMAVSAGAWVLHIAALELAPLSLVQATIAAGLVSLAVLADRCFGLRLGRRQWLGVSLVGVGLGLLALTAPGFAHQAPPSAMALLGFEIGLLGLGAALALGAQRGAAARRRGPLLGLTAGLLFGVCDVAIKALTLLPTGQIPTSPWLAFAVLPGLLAFLVSARSLQLGEAVPTITATALGANLTGIAGGLLVFGDPLPQTWWQIAAHCLALLLLVGAAALVPSPRTFKAAPAG